MNYPKVFIGLFTIIFLLSVFFSFSAYAQTDYSQSETTETETAEPETTELETSEPEITEPEITSPAGDIDGDGIITSSDAKKVLIFSLGIETSTRSDIDKADVDRDGYITLNDARAILRIAAGIDASSEHIYSPWKIEIEATCKTNGMESSVCTHCGSVKTKITPKIHHSAGICPLCGEEFISYTSENKEIVFGDCADTVTEIFGEPTEILKSGSNTIFIYEIYEKAKLEVFFFDKNGLCEVYSTDKLSYFSDGEKNIVLKEQDPFTEKGVTYYFFEDTQSSKRNTVYGVRALLNGTNASSFNKSGNNNALEKTAFYLVNQCRAMNGVPMLEYNDDVAVVALTHSADMADRNYYSHEDPEGKKVYDRIVEAGLSRYGNYGENICAASLNPFNANDGWYNSTKGHRENILNPNFKYFGAGFAYNGSSTYKFYGTQVFFTPYK